MPSVTVSNQVAAPVDTVFSLFTDIERAAEHVEGIKEIEMLTPSRPFGLGTRWLETREVLGRLDTVEMEVTSFEKNRTYTVTHHKGGARIGASIDTVFSFEPAGEGTKVTIEFDLESPGMPPGILVPLGWAIAGRVRDALTHDLADMKASAEK